MEIEFSEEKAVGEVYRFILSDSEFERICIPYGVFGHWNCVYRKTVSTADNGWRVFYLEKFEPNLTADDYPFWDE